MQCGHDDDNMLHWGKAQAPPLPTLRYRGEAGACAPSNSQGKGEALLRDRRQAMYGCVRRGRNGHLGVSVGTQSSHKGCSCAGRDHDEEERWAATRAWGEATTRPRP